MAPGDYRQTKEGIGLCSTSPPLRHALSMLARFVWVPARLRSPPPIPARFVSVPARLRSRPPILARFVSVPARLRSRPPILARFVSVPVRPRSRPPVPVGFVSADKSALAGSDVAFIAAVGVGISYCPAVNLFRAVCQPTASFDRMSEQSSPPKSPLVIFHRLIPTARLPQRADRSAAGSLPTRAFRYCEPATSAAGFGYYVFPPLAFSLQWDGQDIVWTFDGAADWYPLKSAQFPGFRDLFNSIAPKEIVEFAPPFLVALQEPGLLQMWTGMIARTAPGWSLLVRAPANLARRGGYEPFEGIIETDRWFGPLITNIRLTKTDVPIDFNADFPLLQVQPVPRHAYSEDALNNYELVPDLKQLTPADWDAYYDSVVRPHVQEARPRGQYAAAARKRRASETDGVSAN